MVRLGALPDLASRSCTWVECMHEAANITSTSLSSRSFTTQCASRRLPAGHLVF